MITLLFLCAYFCAFSFVIGFMPMEWEKRPTLEALGMAPVPRKRRKSWTVLISSLAMINKPLCKGPVQARLIRDLAVAHVKMSPEEFFLVKEIGVVLILFVSYPSVSADMMLGWIAAGFVGGYMIPEFWLKGRIKRVKGVIIKELPDAIDLLGLCVNAGLDFMLSLKWVVEKSAPSVMIDELNTVLQEINVGKTRRDAIRDLAARYELPDLSTFSRTLIQADKMGTSVTEALNILSEDMRIARYRRGEQLALKAPMKMLVPLLFFIFPVVGILVAGPILIDFMENNPFQQISGGR
ncbi:MAG TPA: type II secretion system F family protein [Candidatus Omnitrophota bacterium]|nr:type II secretion system F family protein [Candidatus Omnitrophota bacterium]